MQHVRQSIFIILSLGVSLAFGLKRPVQVTFKASDGATVYGEYFEARNRIYQPLVIMFHQAGSNGRGEYGRIAQQVSGRGYNVLLVDQRSGGDRFGSENRTVKARGGESTNYHDAYPDLEGSLVWAQEKEFAGLPYVWGSSYSAALVIRLAAEHPKEVKAVLAFSPASSDAMGPSKPALFIEKVKVPVLALRPIGEMENPSAKAQFAQFEDLGVQTYVSNPGVHGSSMLVKERAGGDTKPTWDVVFDFLTVKKSTIDSSK